MKSYILSLILPAVIVICTAMLSGCGDNGNEIFDNGNPALNIVFGKPVVSDSDTGTDSRASLLNTLPESSTAKVIGCCVPRSVSDYKLQAPSQASLPWVLKANYSTYDIFDQIKLTVTGGRLTYGGNPVPWCSATDANMAGLVADEATYTFMSYYPADDSWSVVQRNDAGNGTTGAPRFIYTYPDGEAADAMVAAKFDHKKKDGQVNLTYRHILTGIRFRINNYSGKDIVLHELKIKGDLYTKASFDFNEGFISRTTDGITAPREHTVFGPSSDLTVIADSSSPVYSTEEDRERGTTLMLLPNPDITPDANNGDCIGKDKKIILNYTIGTESTKQTIPFNLLFIPQPGVTYNLNLNFVGDEFVIYLSPTDTWENGSDNNLDIN